MASIREGFDRFSGDPEHVLENSDRYKYDPNLKSKRAFRRFVYAFHQPSAYVNGIFFGKPRPFAERELFAPWTLERAVQSGLYQEDNRPRYLMRLAYVVCPFVGYVGMRKFFRMIFPPSAQANPVRERKYFRAVGVMGAVLFTNMVVSMTKTLLVMNRTELADNVSKAWGRPAPKWDQHSFGWDPSRGSKEAHERYMDLVERLRHGFAHFRENEYKQRERAAKYLQAVVDEAYSEAADTIRGRPLSSARQEFYENNPEGGELFQAEVRDAVREHVGGQKMKQMLKRQSDQRAEHYSDPEVLVQMKLWDTPPERISIEQYDNADFQYAQIPHYPDFGNELANLHMNKRHERQARRDQANTKVGLVSLLTLHTKQKRYETQARFEGIPRHGTPKAPDFMEDVDYYYQQVDDWVDGQMKKRRGGRDGEMYDAYEESREKLRQKSRQETVRRVGAGAEAVQWQARRVARLVGADGWYTGGKDAEEAKRLGDIMEEQAADDQKLFDKRQQQRQTLRPSELYVQDKLAASGVAFDPTSSTVPVPLDDQTRLEVARLRQMEDKLLAERIARANRHKRQLIREQYHEILTDREDAFLEDILDAPWTDVPAPSSTDASSSSSSTTTSSSSSSSSSLFGPVFGRGLNKRGEDAFESAVADREELIRLEQERQRVLPNKHAVEQQEGAAGQGAASDSSVAFLDWVGEHRKSRHNNKRGPPPSSE